MANKATTSAGKEAFNRAASGPNSGNAAKDPTKRSRLERKQMGNLKVPINSKPKKKQFHSSQVQGAIPRSKTQASDN